MAANEPERRLLSAPLDATLYLGATRQGQTLFLGDGQGWVMRTRKTTGLVDAGPGITIAGGLTECCARIGRGKVYFVPKGYLVGTQSTLSRGYTENYLKTPSLLYVDFHWNDQLREEWFSKVHWQRIDLLNARANALHTMIPVMPINITYERDNYDNVRIFDGFPGSVNLFYNRSGETYLGFADEMSQYMEWWSRRATTQLQQGDRRDFWQADKGNLLQFRAVSGPDIVRRLGACYRRQRPESIWRFGTIVEKMIEAHNEWVGNGGYTIEHDPWLGEDLAQKVKRAMEHQADTAEAGSRLQELQQQVTQWDAFAQLALDGYRAAASQGVTAASLFMVEDEEWNQLAREKKLVAIEIWALEEEVGTRGQQRRYARPASRRHRADDRGEESGAVDDPGIVDEALSSQDAVEARRVYIRITSEATQQQDDMGITEYDTQLRYDTAHQLLVDMREDNQIGDSVYSKVIEYMRRNLDPASSDEAVQSGGGNDADVRASGSSTRARTARLHTTTRTSRGRQFGRPTTRGRPKGRGASRGRRSRTTRGDEDSDEEEDDEWMSGLEQDSDEDDVGTGGVAGEEEDEEEEDEEEEGEHTSKYFGK